MDLLAQCQDNVTVWIISWCCYLENFIWGLELMGCPYLCIVACAHLGNGAGHRTEWWQHSLNSGPLMYEAGLHSFF